MDILNLDIGINRIKKTKSKFHFNAENPKNGHTCTLIQFYVITSLSLIKNSIMSKKLSLILIKMNSKDRIWSFLTML
jgi:hypothetical protein